MKLILVSGFLGAGKTTAIAGAAFLLQQKGYSVAVITNDQGQQLVDTQFLQDKGIATSQVTDGCFCCRFPQLEAVLQQIQQKEKPEYIFAEAVGSCTDLVATVLKPLQQQYQHVQLCLTVVADAMVLFRQLRMSRFVFKKQVQYIFDQQLHEADIVVVSKIDLLTTTEQRQLELWMRRMYPSKIMRFQNSLEMQPLAFWLQAMDNFQPSPRHSLSIDYETYGAGEAALAWLDAVLTFKGTRAVVTVKKFMEGLSNTLRTLKLPIGHLKFLVKAGAHTQKISVTSTESVSVAAFNMEHQELLILTVNARVECQPEILEDIVRQTIRQTANAHTGIYVEELKCFKPGYPLPFHRVGELM